MFRVGPRLKAKQSLKGWKPKIRGGNGKLTVPQVLLAAALGWQVEFPVKTGMTPAQGWPWVYKLDIANPTLKIAVEVDGKGHATELGRVQDQKKDGFLKQRGWTVLRFWNSQVLKNLDACAQTVMSTISKLKTTTTILPMAS